MLRLGLSHLESLGLVGEVGQARQNWYGEREVVVPGSAGQNLPGTKARVP